VSTYPGLNEDFADMLRALEAAEARYVVVGAHALAVHGIPRATGDLDCFVCPSHENAERVVSALRAFGAPIEQHGVTAADFERPGNVYQIGLPPRRIDLLTEISGVDFEQAWAGRVEAVVDGLLLPVLGRTELLQNKRAAGRPKDLADVASLEHDEGRRPGASQEPGAEGGEGGGVSTREVVLREGGEAMAEESVGGGGAQQGRGVGRLGPAREAEITDAEAGQERVVGLESDLRTGGGEQDVAQVGELFDQGGVARGVDDAE